MKQPSSMSPTMQKAVARFKNTFHWDKLSPSQQERLQHLVTKEVKRQVMDRLDFQPGKGGESR